MFLEIKAESEGESIIRPSNKIDRPQLGYQATVCLAIEHRG